MVVNNFLHNITALSCNLAQRQNNRQTPQEKHSFLHNITALYILGSRTESTKARKPSNATSRTQLLFPTVGRLFVTSNMTIYMPQAPSDGFITTRVCARAHMYTDHGVHVYTQIMQTGDTYIQTGLSSYKEK